MKITLSELKQIIRQEVKRARRLNENAEINEKVKEILSNTDSEYLETTLKTRNPGSNIQAGSVFKEKQTINSLKDATWSVSDDKGINTPAIGYKANIPGILGMADINKLKDDALVKFQIGHGGKDQFLEPIANFDKSLRQNVEFTTLIAGPDRNNPEKLVVWTFFPGGSLPPYTYTKENFMEAFPGNIEMIVSVKEIKKKLPDIKYIKYTDQRINENSLRRRNPRRFY